MFVLPGILFYQNLSSQILYGCMDLNKTKLGYCSISLDVLDAR